MTEPPDAPFLNVKEAARILCVGPEWVRIQLRRGVLKGLKPASPTARWLISSAAIDRYLQKAQAPQSATI